jgi:metal-sulfur cluster biosynthetic enzyme
MNTVACARPAQGALEERVLRALDAVIDPELDESITALRFVGGVTVTHGADVEVVLRLPTPQCAPNFAFLMAADARDAVRRLPGIGRVTVTLDDHYTADEINAALNDGRGFTDAFPGETDDDELGALRQLFQRKALIARQAAVYEEMLGAGADASAVASAIVAELPDSAPARRCLELRRQLGIDTGPDAPAFVLPDGGPLEADQVQRWLRMARLVRTSLEANGGICRSLLHARHDLATESQEVLR